MIRIGPVGWTHPSLAALLPPEAQGGGTRPLAFLARYFGYLESDAARHAPLRREHVARWRAALADTPRTRLGVQLPLEAIDLTRSAAERGEALEGAIEALGPLLGRPQLGALVAELPADLIHGPAETRALAAIARSFGPGAPLVMVSAHHSWFESPAPSGLRGAGWSLAALDDSHDPAATAQVVPRPREAPRTGPVSSLRVQLAAVPPPEAIREMAARARGLTPGHRIVSFDSRRDPAASILAAFLLKRAMTPPEQQVHAWPAALARLRGLRGPEQGSSDRAPRPSGPSL